MLSCVGYYLYSEASWPRQKGDKARLASGFLRSLPQGDTTCRLRFYFHMFGPDIGSLNVYTRPCNGCAETLVYSRSGNVGNFWDRAEVILRSTVPFQVWTRFVVIINNYNTRFFLWYPAEAELDMITRDLECPWHDYCIVYSCGITGFDFENSLYTYSQWEKS